MGDVYPKLRAAAVQASSVFLDREGSTAKACDLIRQAGREGARLVAFPEGFIPAHPIWFHFHAGTSRISSDLSVELFKNAVQIPGPEIEQLREAAADAGTYVVIGVCEKAPNTFGTLHNSQVFLGAQGEYLGRRQKLMPTMGERLVHTGGHGDSFEIFQTDFGRLSALICGENSNPLAIFALSVQYPQVHVMSWPTQGPPISSPQRTRVTIDSQAFAQMTKAYVVSACGTVNDDAISALQLSKEDERMLREPAFCGGSVIVAPDSRVIAGPLGSEEDILYADLDLEVGVRLKLRHDFAGHYNRADIFRLQLNTAAPQLIQRLDATAALLLESPSVSPPFEPRPLGERDDPSSEAHGLSG